MNDAATSHSPIDIDLIQQESDVRHEPPPLSLKLADSSNASTDPQCATPPNPDTLPISPPAQTPTIAVNNTEPPLDVAMSEPPQVTLDRANGEQLNGNVNGSGKVNGFHHPDEELQQEAPDVFMEGPMHPPPATNGTHSPVNGYSSTVDEEGPPTKRARKHSDADQASTHFATPPPTSHMASPVPESAVPNSASTATFAEPPPLTATTDGYSSSPPPPSTSMSEQTPFHAPMPVETTPVPASAVYTPAPPPPPVPTGPSSISVSQHRFMLSTVRNLKKMKDATPFVAPVDPIKLQIPHYFSIVTQPMDLSTVERKLASSNPSRPDPNPLNPRYTAVDQFTVDVRRIFSNCTLFNGADHAVTHMGKRVEEAFLRSIKQMPPSVENKPPPPKKITPPPPPPPVASTSAPIKKEKAVTRRASTTIAALPPVRRNDESLASARPKRETHPPPPKDLPHNEPPKKRLKAKRGKDDAYAEQFKYCSKILSDLWKKQHANIASPFYEPVDWQAMNLPDYPKMVKKPMDMSTIRRKLDNGEYLTPVKFYEDFKLMIRNCLNYNPGGSIVNTAGIELQRLFDEKWRHLPAVRKPSPDMDESSAGESDEGERQRKIQALENQMLSMTNQLSALKGGNKVKDIKKKEKKPVNKPPVPSTSKPLPPKPTKPVVSKKKSKKAAAIEDDALSFDQKKDLSDAIGRLEGETLEKVIKIIHDSVPELKNSSEEIELEVDSLPPSVLIKLYNLVIRPLKAGPKRNRGKSTGTGTGGLKRKSMDEDVEAEKIRRLEERMALFDNAGGSASAAISHAVGGAESDSDSSSGSDSSGSDSE